MTNLSVFSEIGKLRAVAVHQPGAEVDYMTPSLMHELLFDDILFGKEARQEHQLFAAVLGKVADDVVDIQDLLAQALEQEQAKVHFLDSFCALHKLTPARRELLASFDGPTLAKYAIGGWYEESNNGADYHFPLPPLPNLLFMRDPAAIIGNGASINNMATSARAPEPFLLDTILRFHPKWRLDTPEHIWFNAIPSFLNGFPQAGHTIEGGDIIVVSENILAVGVSIRTTQAAVTELADQLRGKHEFKTLLAVLMPQERAVMHLDTVFTRIDEERCLIFPPFFEPKNPHALPVIRMDLTTPATQISLKSNLLQALKDEGLDLKPIYCGGNRKLDQEREQWTDGANAFCLAPGVILGYSRNTKTATELAKNGYHILDTKQALGDDINLLDGKRYFIGISGNELSRARGGPRCMTMPLKRDPV